MHSKYPNSNMKSISKILPLAIVLLLAACGGGDSPSDPEIQKTDYELAVQLAKVKAAEVRSMAATSPCSQDSHCSSLQLSPTFNDPCNFVEDVDFSILSNNAIAAQQAATEYSALATAARLLAPPLQFGTSCSGQTLFRPLVCTANKCTRL